MRILYITCAQNGFFGLKHIIECGLDVAAVVTIDQETAKKFNVSGYVDISGYVREQGIPLIKLAGYEVTLNDLEGVDADILIVNGWNRLIKSNVLATFRYGAIGVHAGHPPVGLGRAPLVWNILLGHSDLEVYIFRLTARADDGDLVARHPVEITHWDTIMTLYEKVMFQASRLLIIALRKIEQGSSGQSQALEFAKFYQKRAPEDGIIDFTQNEVAIYNFVRAQSPPYPGAFTYLGSACWHIFEAVPFDRFAFRDERRVPGRIVAALPSGLVVMTGGATISVRSAQSSDGQSWPCEMDRMESVVGNTFSSVRGI